MFKIQSEVYRFMGPMREAEGQQPKCLQTFFVDADVQANFGNQRFGVDVDLLKDLRRMLESCSSYVRSFVTIDEQLQHGLLPQTVQLELLANHQPSTEHRGRYNVPTSNSEIAILIGGETRSQRSIIIQPRAQRNPDTNVDLQFISETHRSWDPLQYVLMFPYGTDGFHLGIVKNIPSNRTVTAMEYYCYRLMQRSGVNIILRRCRVFQQYVVDGCAKIELQRLNFIRYNQKNLRSDL